ncbi:MAG: hypothetical protein M0Q44_21775 [Methylobacter sp.]|jgi:hypothetical protein|nr:hypothetical protein [Methylobacter sp.]
MIYTKMAKKIAVDLAFALLALIFSQAAMAACSKNGSGEITDTSTCYAQPDEYYMTVYRMGLCTAQPGAPTTTTAADLSSCTTVFQNTAGSNVSVKKGISTALVGTITRPPNGAYVYGFIELAPQFQVRHTQTFSPARAVVGNVTGGRYCWTKDGSEYVYSNSISGFPVDCGSVASGVGLTTQLMNSFEANNGTNSPVYVTSGSWGASYLVSADYKLGSGSSFNSSGTIARLIGLAAMSVTISPTTGGMNTAFDVTQGTTVVMNDGLHGGTVGDIVYFGGGPFSMIMSLQ